ncbi:MAG: ribosome small subunit-dependent GTPase A [Flavobacteriales bacterium]|nr:ribosome small subunit-dependent GTPase A [Flavobacteriales bacterium]
MADLRKGTVIRSTGSWSSVMDEHGTVLDCRLRGQYRLKGLRTTSPISVGDKVEFEIEPETGKGVIQRIEERKNYIIRKSVNLSKEAHIIASNVDQALIIATVHLPRTSYGFIDRFLCTAEAYNIPAAVLINKCDLNTDKKTKALQQEYVATYQKVGYRVFVASALDGFGMNELKTWMNGKVTLVSGHSGVGKSTLINSLVPELNLRTAEISEVHSKGTHTTTFAEMFPLEGSGYIIDTPGIKEFGMIDMDKYEISHFFPEIFRSSEHCKFNNCLHLNEPGCAVRNDVESGEIPTTRYSSYISIIESIG